ncbi:MULTISPECIES: sce7726 family protein [Bacillaceae]|nr:MULTISPECIES: sce7726 family protein [Bacillaceae]
MSNNIILNRLFTPSVFLSLINHQDFAIFNTCIKRYLSDIDLTSNNHKIITKLYHYLRKQYRNEYYYKNTLLNKILLGSHSLNTTVALSEIPVNKSKADFVLINGKATVYEIKTELDTFDRLDSQINDYYKMFNRVCVVTSESNYNKLNDKLYNSNVGISVLTNRNTISPRKQPIEDNSHLEHSSMFRTLRKKEFENILNLHFGELPKTTQVNYYKECLRWFNQINIEILYPYLLAELKKRNIGEKEEFLNVPYELKSLVYFSKFKKDDYHKLEDFLSETWRG